jgi:hypothetical protein
LKNVLWPALWAFFLGAASLPLFVVAFFVFLALTPNCCSRFDATKWKMAGEGTDLQQTRKEEKCVRGRMLTDLRLRYLKAGMRKEELFALLGPPTQSGDDKARGCFSYVTGYCRGLGFSLNFVTFCFDASGHLSNGGGEDRG